MEEKRDQKSVEGFGRIFRPRFTRKHPDGRTEVYSNVIWWISYYHHGKEYRESARSSEEKKAIKLLKERVKDLGRGVIGTVEEKITFEYLCEDLKNDYKTNGKRSMESVVLSIGHLEKFFSGDRARDITSDRIRKYIAKRQTEGAANASINRELSALKRGFSLAIQAGKLFYKPHVPSLEENNVRTGFLDHGGFLALREQLPDYLRDSVSFLYLSGWRSGEMKSLEWRDVAGDMIRLRPENSKNKKPRVLPLRGELAEIIERAKQARTPECLFVFHVDSQPIVDFRKAWYSACVAAGRGYFEPIKNDAGKVIRKKYHGLVPHDLRRSAVRNFVAAGIPEKVAMGLSGHKTRSVFDRYHIVSEDDLAAASDRLFVHLERQAEAAKVVPIRKAS